MVSLVLEFRAGCTVEIGTLALVTAVLSLICNFAVARTDFCMVQVVFRSLQWWLEIECKLVPW